MKFLVLSDLHIESGAYTPATDVEYDVLILAGDIHPAGGSLPDWAVRRFGGSKPIVIVPGNHEFYGTVMEDERVWMSSHRCSNVHLLDPGVALLDGGRVRVLGCTLWTDFDLPVRVSLPGTSPLYRSDPRHAMREALSALNDYARILVVMPAEDDDQDLELARAATPDDGLLPRMRRLQPHDTLRMHHEQRDWLLARLQEPFAGTTVVVTHHGPSRQSVAERWADDWVSAAFASELPDAFFEVPALWVHGHTHTSFDYVQGHTRIVCNPRGYQLRDGSRENPRFDSRLVIDTDVPDPQGTVE